MNQGGYRSADGGLPERVAAALAAAEIAPSKFGPARRSRLNDPERALYLWILRRFGTGGRPSRLEVEGQAEQLDLTLVAGAVETEHRLQP
jgi:hypothetical protein